MRARIGVQRRRLMNPGREPDRKRALRPVLSYERAELLGAAMLKAAPRCASTLERLFGNVDRRR